MEDSGGRKSEKEFLFDLILKQSDIQEAHLAVPRIHAETHFLSVSGSSSSSSSGRNFTVHHNFLDNHGKTWVFSLSSFHGVFYALTGGWDRFAEEKGLVDGDTLSFWRIPRKHGDGGDDLFFIDYEKPSLGEEKAGSISDAHQVFDEMSQINVDGCGSSGDKSLASEMRGLSERGSHISTITTSTTTQSQVSPTVSRRDAGGFDEGRKLCTFVGCSREAHNDNELCIVHFSRTICEISGCKRPAHGPSILCSKHGGGKSCQFLGCIRSARGKSGLCIRHGGGKRCQFVGCTKSAKGLSGLCVAHGGGRRCQFVGCSKAARGRTDFCVTHGGGKKGKKAERVTDVCRVHGGGKQDSWGGQGERIVTQTSESSTESEEDAFACDRSWGGQGERIITQTCESSTESEEDAFACDPGNSLRLINTMPEKTQMESKKFMFQKALTPSDVGKLDRLVVPYNQAEKYFPKLSANKEKGLMLYFEDATRKMWRFYYSFWYSNQSYVLSKGWSRFVKEKLLSAGDTVSFYSGVEENGKNKLFITCSIRALNLGLHPPLNPASPHPPMETTSLAYKPQSISLCPFLERASSFCGVSDSDAASLVCPPLGLGLHLTQNPTLPPLLFESPPLSFDHHSPLQSASHFDGLIHDDAFVFCALCPPNHEFEKDTLVQLWIAYGVFVEEPMERIASQFFEDCLSEGYFQFSKTNLVTGKAMYRFKGDSSLTPIRISRDSYIASIEGSSNINDISPDVFHVSIRCSSLIDITTISGLKKFEKLRTLMFLQGHELSIKQVPRNFFSSLKLLRVLDLSRTRLMELPSSIGNMKDLCFLDLSETPIKRLPEAIDCLENLQTLKLRCCSNLCSLPKGMKKLVNLRHLDFDVLRQLRSMPQGMGALTNIQTLSAFLVGVEEGCNLRQLKNMNNLSGSFCISRLENVLTHDEAVEACLSKKSHIKKLKMHWSDSQDEDVVGYTKVLSSLQPNTSLEELCISGYDGIELPFWICDPEYSKLVSITLFDCENCLVLPPLGRLHSLKVLNIVNFYKLKVIDHNFYGGLPSEPYVAFPTLERLTVENMFSLEEWSGIGNFSFPHLLKLTVKHCPKLHSLRTLSCLCSLESLEISHCEMLASCTGAKLPARVKTFIVEDCALISARILNDGGQDGLKVSHIPHVWIDHQEMLFDQRNPQA